MARLIKADGETSIVHPQKNGKEFTLQELQNFVGGYIELVPIYNPEYASKIMYCNEEGRLIGLPDNREASRIAGISIVGDVIICEPGETN